MLDQTGSSVMTNEVKKADTVYPLLDLLVHRYSPRIFAEQKVDESDLLTLFEAARWAPSSSNLQPWRFLYAYRNSDHYDKIFSCLSEFNRKWVGNAPVVVLAAYHKKRKDGVDNFHALHDLGLAVSMMTVQAQSMNIALHQMAGVDWKKAHEIFNVPDDYHVATAIAIGYYGGKPEDLSDDLYKSEIAERERKPLDEIIARDQWKWTP